LTGRAWSWNRTAPPSPWPRQPLPRSVMRASSICALQEWGQCPARHHSLVRWRFREHAAASPGRGLRVGAAEGVSGPHGATRTRRPSRLGSVVVVLQPAVHVLLAYPALGMSFPSRGLGSGQ
jgi:hypothetical protein